MMKTFAIHTLGCKVNQYDSQQLRQLLEDLGLCQMNLSQADLVIVNSCCITATASAKTRQFIHKAQKQSPIPTIVLIGCMATVKIDGFDYANSKIHIVSNRQETFGKLRKLVKGSNNPLTMQTAQNNQNLRQERVIRANQTDKIKHKNLSGSSNELGLINVYKGSTRAFLKVQDGCDNYCTYCIIPMVRPDIISLNIDDILAQARRFVKSGHREIIVTGINLGAYGQKTTRRRKWPTPENAFFVQLIEKIAQIDGLERLRLSSVEPSDITEPLLKILCKYDNIMPHLHMSLQSGSDNILKRMCRQYRSADFVKKVNLIKTLIPDISLTTDIIVGFAGETDEDFQETVDFAKSVGFSRIHVFPFSARQGTPAAKLKNHLPPAVIKKRAKIMRQTAEELAFSYRQKFIGQTAKVLIEGNNTNSGLSEHYFEVEIDSGKPIPQNSIAKVKLIANQPHSAKAKLIRFD